MKNTIEQFFSDIQSTINSYPYFEIELRKEDNSISIKFLNLLPVKLIVETINEQLFLSYNILIPAKYHFSGDGFEANFKRFLKIKFNRRKRMVIYNEKFKTLIKYMNDFVQNYILEFRNITQPAEKISAIHFRKFRQFSNNLFLDFTYPQGHALAGQPLKRICFIGQSGTGKTSILQLLKTILSGFGYNAYSDEDNSVNIYYRNNKIKFIHLLPEDKIFSSSIVKTPNNEKIIIEEGDLIKTKLINFPADLIKQMELINDRRQNSFNEKESIIDFDIQSTASTWQKIKEEIQLYNETEIAEKLKISDAHISNDNELLEKAKESYENWTQNSDNPIKALADNLNPFLNRFGLKVKTSLDFKRIDDLKFIRIETLQNKDVGDLDSVLSTGTKQILLTALPLFTLKPKNSIVLFDEPERSLYPDIQKEIVDYYTSLGNNCQYFFATHSPVIASSFEPWEIVELKFDNEGYVYQEHYYEGERHIDNYFKDARLLDYGDILTEIFDIKSDEREDRINALMKLAKLKKQLEKTDLSEEQRTEKYAEFKRLAKLVNWNFEK